MHDAAFRRTYFEKAALIWSYYFRGLISAQVRDAELAPMRRRLEAARLADKHQ